MAKFSDIIKEGNIFVCDHCKKEFTAKKIKLQEPVDNPGILSFTMPFKFVDKDGILTEGYEPAKKEIGDRVLTCPYCDVVNLFGFDLKS